MEYLHLEYSAKIHSPKTKEFVGRDAGSRLNGPLPPEWNSYAKYQRIFSDRCGFYISLQPAGSVHSTANCFTHWSQRNRAHRVKKSPRRYGQKEYTLLFYYHFRQVVEIFAEMDKASPRDLSKASQINSITRSYRPEATASHQSPPETRLR